MLDDIVLILYILYLIEIIGDFIFPNSYTIAYICQEFNRMGSGC